MNPENEQKRLRRYIGYLQRKLDAISCAYDNKDESENLQAYITRLREKLDFFHWTYNDYETWCEFNDVNQENNG